jgi:hypothetical protein
MFFNPNKIHLIFFTRQYIFINMNFVNLRIELLEIYILYPFGPCIQDLNWHEIYPGHTSKVSN